MEELMKETLEHIAGLQKQINRAFGEAWAKFPSMNVSLGVHEPPADLEDRGDEYLVYVEVPGFSKDQIRIKASENSIEVTAERTEEEEEALKEGNFILRQRFYKGVHKKIDLPGKVRPEEAKATVEKGVVEIHVPKASVSEEVEVSLE